MSSLVIFIEFNKDATKQISIPVTGRHSRRQKQTVKYYSGDSGQDTNFDILFIMDQIFIAYEVGGHNTTMWSHNTNTQSFYIYAYYV